MNHHLNKRAREIVDRIASRLDDLRIAERSLENDGRIYDFGAKAEGGIAAGVELARLCMAGLGDVSIVSSSLNDSPWPHVQVVTDQPVAACLFSQYAGWQVNVGKFFGMGSGPMRAAAAKEELFHEFGYSEKADSCVGVIEGSKLPDAAVFDYLAEATGVSPKAITLCIARTASQAGNVQIVARSVETALHKLHEVGFDVNRVRSGWGIAPLPPVAKDDLTGIGRTNDAILYAGRVVLCVRGDDESIAAIGPKIPSDSSDAWGKPFCEVFEEAGHDFYKIDPLLFSPAEVVFQNLDTGRTQSFGRSSPDVVRKSFGM